MTRHPELPERDRRILGVVVQAYIDQGEPVSSLWLAGQGFGVSSATLRNIMAKLEEYGYVRQPHTSAGRVPTDLGYRAYVDQLLAERRTPRPAPQVEARLRLAGTVDDLLNHVSQEVSRASHHVGFAIAPASDTATLEHLEFVPLDAGKILVVLIAAGGQITHKVITPSERYESVELQQAANYLNSQFRGRALTEVRQAVLERLLEAETLYDALMERALRLANSTFEDMVHAPTVYIQGASLLLDDVDSEYAAETLQALRTLLEMIDEKARLVQLLDAYLSGTGLTVVIGSEHQAPDLRRFSVVAATYNDGRGTGAVGVIGPTRMRYSRSINVVDSLARAINRVVSKPDA
jgi:heat-inducible transcriptional repressor